MTERAKADPDETALLRISGLNFSFPGQDSALFQDLNLTVHRGETVVIMGGSGTGKSTLAEILFELGDLPPPTGKVDFQSSRAALLLQRGAVFEHLSVGGNVGLVLRRMGRPSGFDAIRAALAKVNLDHHSQDRRADTLSGGEQRRLALARALSVDPDFLYFDEPSAGLDLDNVLAQGRLIRQVVRGGKGAVVVTHDPLLAALTADRVLLLDHGRLKPLADWSGGPDRLDESQERERTDELERLLTGRFGTRPSVAAEITPLSARLAKALNPLALGDHALGALRALGALPAALRHPRDFLAVFWRSCWLSGISGFPFFALIGAILGATFIMILLGASILPARITLDKVQAVPLTAITAPLCGFLFAARSGSALASWLGGMSYSRQVDALKTLTIDPDQYLRSPVWLGMVCAYGLCTAVLFGTMWAGAYVLCVTKVGIPDPVPYLQPFGNGQITTQALIKVPIYALITATVTTQIGLAPKPTSEAVAHGITRVIITCTVAVALVELTFAGLLAVGGGVV